MINPDLKTRAKEDYWCRRFKGAGGVGENGLAKGEEEVFTIFRQEIMTVVMIQPAYIPCRDHG